jgi:hypothetical protein
MEEIRITPTLILPHNCGEEKRYVYHEWEGDNFLWEES